MKGEKEKKRKKRRERKGEIESVNKYDTTIKWRPRFFCDNYF